MNNEGQDASKWLRQITKDQNLDRIAQINSTPWDGLRRWFVSRMVTPTINLGYYDGDTGQAELGLPAYEAERLRELASYLKTATDTTSAATKVWSPAAGKVWLVISVTMYNGTRAPKPVYKTSDGTTDVYNWTSDANLTQSFHNQLMTGGTTENPGGTHSPLVLDAAGSVTAGDANFVAADSMIYNIVYYEVDA